MFRNFHVVIRQYYKFSKLPTGLALSTEQIAKPVVPGSKWVASTHTEYFRYSLISFIKTLRLFRVVAVYYLI
jgi:hypothetical protein